MKKTLRRFAPVALVLIGLATLSFMAKDGIKLRLQPKQGKTYTITSKANMMMMMEAQGQTMNQTQNMEYRQSFAAKNVTEKDVQLETKIEAMKMSISQMGMKLEYDSEHPEKTSPMLAGQTKEMDDAINKTGTIKYDVMGHVIDSLNLEMNQLGSVVIQLPEQELRVGSTWSVDKSQSVSGTEMNVHYTYTVAAIPKKSVDLTVEGTVSSKGTEEISGNYTGTASIDPQQGFVAKSNLKVNLSMTLSQQGLSIPVTIVGNTSIEVK
ncbi:MAG: hypothetical protein IJQ11_03875 [Bacteroidales bacterium]|nr:hypothetical protein [Bacteroidales bacterium]